MSLLKKIRLTFDVFDDAKRWAQTRKVKPVPINKCLYVLGYYNTDELSPTVPLPPSHTSVYLHIKTLYFLKWVTYTNITLKPF